MAHNFNTYQIHKQLWNSITWGKKCHLLFSSLCSSASLWSNWSANRLALAARPLFKSSQSNWTISKWATVGKELISRASERNCWISCNSKMRLLWRQITLNALSVQWLYNNNNNNINQLLKINVKLAPINQRTRVVTTVNLLLSEYFRMCIMITWV